MRIRGNTPKGNQIYYSAIKYLFYVIANTLQAHGDFTRVNEEDMLILAKAAITNCNLTPNLGALLVFYLKHQALKSRGPICGEGVVTVLARALHVNLGNIQPLTRSDRLSLSNLRACGMISKNHGKYFFDIPGADHLIPAPLSNGLFSINDGRLRYDAQVESNLPQQEIPMGGGEDEEVEQGGPKQDVQPPNYYTTYDDIYALE